MSEEGLRAEVEALIEEWESTAETLNDAADMVGDEGLAVAETLEASAAKVRAALAAALPAPVGEGDGLEEVLAAHESLWGSDDYTRCKCGEQTTNLGGLTAHVAAEIRAHLTGAKP